MDKPSRLALAHALLVEEEVAPHGECHQIKFDVEYAARVAHLVNRAYREAIGEDPGPAWKDAPEEQVRSTFLGVINLMKNPDTTPEQSHESWLEEKRRQGWTWGPVKDAEKREHPCFLPYDRLDKEQRVKDHLFRAVVLHNLGMDVEIRA